MAPEPLSESEGRGGRWETGDRHVHFVVPNVLTLGGKAIAATTKNAIET